MCSLLNPRDAGDRVVLEGAKLVHPAGLCIPHVNTGTQADAQHIGTSPIYKVEIEVVCQLGGVQHLVWHLGHGSWLTPRAEQHLLAAKADR